MIKLIKIPDDKYSDYRYDVIFNGYKWDPQVEDHNTVSNYVAVIDEATANELGSFAEKLFLETVNIEEELLKRDDLIKKLGLPKGVKNSIKKITNYCRTNHIRLMRFDFHPTTTGWKISEVNSDVPGGFAEASVLPHLAAKYFDNFKPGTHFGNTLLDAFQKKVKRNGNIALVHATSYSDDRQVMQYIGDHFSSHGFNTYFAAPDHLRWVDKKPVCIINNENIKIDGILRFFPLEWLCNLRRNTGWKGYYDVDVPSCNHPISMLTQSKRLPLVWDELGIGLKNWKELLPETIDPKLIKSDNERWIYKPALGRVGEGISIKGVIGENELKKIKKAVKKEPKNWVAQEKFTSIPINTIDGDSFHLCIGVFSVDGKRAGFYGRISPFERIDARAKDIPILVCKEENFVD